MIEGFIMDHSTYAAIWFFLWGLLWAVYFATDGFDLGVGMMLPFLGETEEDKRAMLKSVGPLWDGNEVWLIAAGGVTFAAFPRVYAVMFSSLYLPLMLILFGLIIRGVSFEFREKLDGAGWKKLWDACQFTGSLLPALLLGVAFANIFAGVPIDGDGAFHGTILTLLTPYGLLGGIFFILMFLLHGSLWLCAHTEGELLARSARTATILWPVTVLAFAAFAALSFFATNLFANFLAHPLLLAVPALGAAAAVSAMFCLKKEFYWRAWFSSGLFIICVTFFGIIGLFPDLFPSNMSPEFSISTANGSSSLLTLKIMLGVALFFVPIVILYQAWAYRLFSKPGPSGEEGY